MELQVARRRLWNPMNKTDQDTNSRLVELVSIAMPAVESFQLQMGFSFPLLRANDLRSSLLNIRARSFLLSCT